MADSAARSTNPMTVSEFLEFTEAAAAGEKWELHDGRPTMMVGGTAAHAVILGNLSRILYEPARRKGCRPISNFLVRADDASLFEPDVAVLCGPIEPLSRFRSDPTFVAEVLSPSTMRFDRVLKFERYRSMPTVQQIAYVYQENVRLESYLRRDGEWIDEPTILVRRDDVLSIPVIGASLRLGDLYDGLDITSG